MSFRFRGLILLLFSCSAFAQEVQFGAVVGTNLTPGFSDFARIQPLPPGPAGTLRVSPGPHQFIVGPKVELLLPKHFSVEADFLHRELSTNTSIVSAPGGSPAYFPFKRIHSTWEFPILGKYTWGSGFVRPFAAAGMSFRTTTPGIGLSQRGATGGVGVQTQWRGLVIEPTIRYTRWAESSAFSVPPAKQDQVEFLVGFHYAGTSAVTRHLTRKMSIGILAGLNLGDDFEIPRSVSSTFRSDSNTAAWGIGLEYRVWRDLSVEADGFYRPTRYTFFSSGVPFGVRNTTTTWVVPVLAKYRLPALGLFRPFVEGGPSFRLTSTLNSPEPSKAGVTAGGGVEWNLWRLRMGPQFRYTRWTDSRAGTSLVRPPENQTQILFGVFF